MAELCAINGDDVSQLEKRACQGGFTDLPAKKEHSVTIDSKSGPLLPPPTDTQPALDEPVQRASARPARILRVAQVMDLTGLKKGDALQASSRGKVSAKREAFDARGRLDRRRRSPLDRRSPESTIMNTTRTAASQWTGMGG